MSPLSPRACLIARARRHLGEIEQILCDAAHWNRAHPDEAPIDPDPDRLLARVAAHYRTLLATDPGLGPIAEMDPALQAELEAERRPQ